MQNKAFTYTRSAMKHVHVTSPHERQGQQVQ